MEKNVDFKKLLKDFYLPSPTPHLVSVPEMKFICVGGKGAPEGESYQQSVAILYTLSYAIRMSYKSGNQPGGFFKYTVAPLEGLWYIAEGNDPADRNKWKWTSMIMQPDFVDGDLFKWAMEQGRKKHPELDFSRAKLETYSEGRCVQIMHTGPYSTETVLFALMDGFMKENGLERVRIPGISSEHHEIYLNDPRRTAPDKLRTVLRIRIKE